MDTDELGQINGSCVSVSIRGAQRNTPICIAGLPVVVLETKLDLLDRGAGNIRRNYESAIKKGKLTQEKFEQHMKLLSTTLDYGAVAGAAVFTSRSRRENIRLKRIFQWPMQSSYPPPAQLWPSHGKAP